MYYSEYTEAVNGIPNTHPKIKETKDDNTIKIIRGKVDSINIYEVSESELSIIESGAPSSLYLNFVTFLSGIFISFLSILLTMTFNLKERKDLILFIIFMLIEVVTGFLTLIMFIIWLTKRKDLSHLIKRIKERIK